MNVSGGVCVRWWRMQSQMQDTRGFIHNLTHRVLPILSEYLAPRWIRTYFWQTHVALARIKPRFCPSLIACCARSPGRRMTHAQCVSVSINSPAILTPRCQAPHVLATSPLHFHALTSFSPYVEGFCLMWNVTIKHDFDKAILLDVSFLCYSFIFLRNILLTISTAFIGSIRVWSIFDLKSVCFKKQIVIGVHFISNCEPVYMHWHISSSSPQTISYMLWLGNLQLF